MIISEKFITKSIQEEHRRESKRILRMQGVNMADTLNTLHFIKHNWKYGKINKVLINYRIHNHNASHNLEKRINASLALYDYIIDLVRKSFCLRLIGSQKRVENNESCYPLHKRSWHRSLNR